MYHISVWHQLEDNRLTLSVEEHTIGTHAILTQLPVGFIFKSSWRHTNTIYMPNHQLCVDTSRSSRILFTLSTMVHTSAIAPRPAGVRAKPHGEIQVPQRQHEARASLSQHLSSLHAILLWKMTCTTVAQHSKAHQVSPHVSS